MSDFTREEARSWIIDHWGNDLEDGTKQSEVVKICLSALSENKGKSKHGHWERMSDLPEDKDDRYKCSRCGNVVHHSSGVNLYHFNSWCGACGSLNNSLLAGLEPKGEKGTE